MGEGSGRIGRVTRYLLVVNLLVVAAGLGVPYLRGLHGAGPSEFNAGKIGLWRQPDTYKTVAQPATPARASAPSALCLAIANLDQERYQALQASVQTAGLVGDKCGYRFDKNLAWWVFWPPEYETARRDKVLKAIVAAGVKDVLPITQGSMAQSYSLGVFNSEAKAHQYRDSLRGKGLDRVEFGPRPSMGAGWLGCVAEAARIDAFKAGLPPWAEPVAERQCWPAGR